MDYEKAFNVDEALTELQTKTPQQIEIETAFKWAGRAIAARRIYRTTDDLKFRDLSIEYAHEAQEHAAAVGDRGATLQTVEAALAYELARLGRT